MSPDHLLDAVGLLDDELIREAEEYSRPKARRGSGYWLGWAASFAVVVVLGYGLTHLGMGGGGATPENSGGAMENRPAASTPAASAPAGEAAPPTNDSAPGSAEPDAPGAAGDASHDLRDRMFHISVRMDEPMNRLSYSFQHWYGKDRTLEQLPEGCVSLGKVKRLDVEELPNVPYTDNEEYVGCEAWLLREDPVWKQFKLYVALPEGGYLECR